MTEQEEKDTYFDWDWTSLIHVIGQQLQKMQQAIFVDGNTLRTKREVRAMKICIHLCNRLLEYSYDDIWLNDPRVSVNYTHVTYKNEHIARLKQLGRLTYRMDLLVPNDRPGRRRLQTYLHVKANNQQKADKDLLFKLMSKYILRWWD